MQERGGGAAYKALDMFMAQTINLFVENKQLAGENDRQDAQFLVSPPVHILCWIQPKGRAQTDRKEPCSFKEPCSG